MVLLFLTERCHSGDSAVKFFAVLEDGHLIDFQSPDRKIRLERKTVEDVWLQFGDAYKADKLNAIVVKAFCESGRPLLEIPYTLTARSDFMEDISGARFHISVNGTNVE